MHVNFQQSRQKKIVSELYVNGKCENIPVRKATNTGEMFRLRCFLCCILPIVDQIWLSLQLHSFSVTNETVKVSS